MNILEKKSIPQFLSAKHFIYIMNSDFDEFRKKEWKREHPNQEFNIVTPQSLLNPTVSK